MSGFFWLPSGHNLHSPRCVRLNISCCSLPSIPKGWLLTLGAKLSSIWEQLGWVKVKRTKCEAKLCSQGRKEPRGQTLYFHHLLWTLGTSRGRAQALGTYLRWPCVGLGWGGLAGTCPRLVSPGDVEAGTHPSCSGKAGIGKCKLLQFARECVLETGSMYLPGTSLGSLE